MTIIHTTKLLKFAIYYFVKFIIVLTYVIEFSKGYLFLLPYPSKYWINFQIQI